LLPRLETEVPNIWIYNYITYRKNWYSGRNANPTNLESCSFAFWCGRAGTTYACLLVFVNFTTERLMNHFDCSKTGFLFAIALRPIYHEDVPVAARGSLRSCRAEKCTSAELPDATKQRITPGHYWHVLSV